MTIVVEVDKRDIEDLIHGCGAMSYLWWSNSWIAGSSVVVIGEVPDSDKPVEGGSDTLDEDGRVWRQYTLSMEELAELMVDEAEIRPCGLLDMDDPPRLDMAMFDADIADRVLQRACFGGIVYG